MDPQGSAAPSSGRARTLAPCLPGSRSRRLPGPGPAARSRLRARSLLAGRFCGTRPSLATIPRIRRVSHSGARAALRYDAFLRCTTSSYASLYLPTCPSHLLSASEGKAEPEYSRQPVISVPREADNRVQTLVTPAAIRLKRNIALPNIVSWSEKLRLPMAPAPAMPQSSLARSVQRLDNAVVAPPPDAARVSHSRDIPTMDASIVAPPPDVRSLSRKENPTGPPPAIIAPPPGEVAASIRQFGEINIGHRAVIAPSPQLPLAEQRTTSGRATGTAALARVTPQVVPPPPSLPASGSSNGGGRMIALNLRPPIGAPADLPDGNRRGSFAATPRGHSGASGNPGASSENISTGTDGRGNGSGKESGTRPDGTSSDLPSGLYVGQPDQPKTSSIAAAPGNSVARNSFPSNSVNPKLIGSVPPSHLSTGSVHPLHPDGESKLSPAEREIFGERKFYSLTLNMPNLNSAGGSWVIRFAALKQDANAGELSTIRSRGNPQSRSCLSY